MTTEVKQSPRERLLEAAATLAYRDGAGARAGIGADNLTGLIAPTVTTLLDAADTH